MYLLEDNELKEINGGSLSGTFISAIVKGVSLIFELGQAFGSAVQRIRTCNLCK